MSQLAEPTFIDRLTHAFHEGDPNLCLKEAEGANVRQLQEQFAALARGDFDSFVAPMADDIELEILGPAGSPFVGRWYGRDQVAEAVRKNFGLVDEQRPEVQSLVAQGDTVVIVARERGRFRQTGREYDVHWVQLHTFRDGKVVRVRELIDSALTI